MGEIEQYFTSDGMTWFEFNMGSITLIEFKLSVLLERILLSDISLN